MFHKLILISIIAVILSATAIHALHVMTPYPRVIKNEIIKLTGNDRGEGHGFGYSVAFEGDILAIGATGPYPGFDLFGKETDAVYIFERTSSSPNSWIQLKQLTPSDEDVENLFGRSIAVSGNTLIVSSINERFYAASAYIYERNAGGSNNWGLVKKIFADDSINYDIFNRSVSVAINKDIAVIGASKDHSNDEYSGSVYVFERNEGGSNNWGFVTKIIASDGVSTDSFGTSVAIENNTLVVGASGDDNQGSSIEDVYLSSFGSAYIYERSDNGWNEIAKLFSESRLGRRGFGTTVRISGDTIAISDRNGNGRGVVYIYERLSNDIPNSWRQK